MFLKKSSLLIKYVIKLRGRDDQFKYLENGLVYT